MKFLLKILLVAGILMFASSAPQFGRRFGHHHHHGHGRFHGGGFGGGYPGGYGGYRGYPGGFGGGYPGGGFGGGQSASYANAQSFSASLGPFSISASNANAAANSFGGFGR
ncbi:uncharacterized protein LOC134829023 [Culicoides brevitarsis]|uniref:uncharacterized protein LOC134829023 n=1 Tax=Culicoides brevitarsis TaxID=469753 RepID=UPI00307C4FDE